MCELSNTRSRGSTKRFLVTAFLRSYTILSCRAFRAEYPVELHFGSFSFDFSSMTITMQELLAVCFSDILSFRLIPQETANRLH